MLPLRALLPRSPAVPKPLRLYAAHLTPHCSLKQKTVKENAAKQTESGHFVERSGLSSPPHGRTALSGQLFLPKERPVEFISLKGTLKSLKNKGSQHAVNSRRRFEFDASRRGFFGWKRRRREVLSWEERAAAPAPPL